MKKDVLEDLFRVPRSTSPIKLEEAFLGVVPEVQQKTCVVTVPNIPFD